MTLVLLRAILVVHVIAVVTQPLMAGFYLSGEVDAMNVHSTIGSTLWMISLLQLAVALVYWRFSGGEIYPAIATLVLLVAELFQMLLGQTRGMTMHVPLGAAIVTGVLVLTAWSFTAAARRPRPVQQPESVG